MTLPGTKMTMSEVRVIISSGYFNPLHVGHVRYLTEAATLADIHIAIVNNDEQVKLKGSALFMNEYERLEIINSLECVSFAVLSLDKDFTVRKTLKALTTKNYYGHNPLFIFAKGGDRTISNIPEKAVCEKLGIQIVCDLGGEKVQASSKLIERILHGETPRT